MVPKGWKEAQLKDVTIKIQDGNYGADYPKANELVSSGIPFLTSKVLGGNGEINREKFVYISPEKHSSLKKGQIKGRDILFTNRGANVGVIALVSDDIVEANIGPQLTLIRCNCEKADYKYLFQSLRGAHFQKQVQQQDSGSAMNFFGIKVTEKFKVFIPPLSEQKKIAQILSAWDKAIATTEKLIANSQQQKKALMQQLLTGKKRFPGFEGGIIRYHFSDVVKIDSNSLGKNTPGDLEFKYISLADVGVGVISGQLETHAFKSAPSRARRIVKDGDILLATVRPNLKGFARVIKEHDGYIASTGFSVLGPKKGFCGDYIYHYLFGAHVTGQISSLVVGSNYPAINSSDVAGLVMYCPEYDEQKKIADFLNKGDDIIRTLVSKLEHLQQEKKALMQQLLTGKRRVKIQNV